MNDAGWIATLLLIVLVVMAAVVPADDEGLPELSGTAQPANPLLKVPVVGPLFGTVRRLMVNVTWRLEMIPLE